MNEFLAIFLKTQQYNLEKFAKQFDSTNLCMCIPVNRESLKATVLITCLCIVGFYW